MALQGHLGTVILGLLAVYGLNMLGTILSTTLFSGTSVLDLVLSEVFLLVVSLIVGIISAGFGYMLLNISRGKEFSLGDLGYFFRNQPDRVIIAGFELGTTVLVVTHEKDLVNKFQKRVITLERGIVVSDGIGYNMR